MLSTIRRTVTAPVEEDGVAIEYSPEVLDEIRRLSVDGFNAFLHGGLETGGVLYGLREANRIVVVSFAELPCEHASGPAFVLSENDRAALSSLMQPPAGLETVGWFRAHTRAGLELDADDRDIFERYFAQP